MRTIRILLVLSLFAQPAAAAGRASALPSGPGAGAPALGLPPSSMAAPAGAGLPAAGMDLTAPTAPTAALADPVAAITGAVTRSHPDLGPIRRMWLVYSSEKDKDKAADMLDRIRAENPGVEVVFHRAGDLLAAADPSDHSFDAKGARAMFERILADEAELVLGTDHDVWESFRSLRDHGYAREIPFGIAKRRFVTVDIPRRSLDPGRLSDPRLLPHRRYLMLGTESDFAPRLAGMEGRRTSLARALAEAEAAEKPEKGAPFWQSLAVRLSGQADDRATAGLRRQAQLLAAWLEDNEIDAVVTDDPAAARVVAQMKREGHHVSVPFVWSGAGAPGDAEGLDMSLAPADWMQASPHVRLAAAPTLEAALKQAAALERLPGNFNEVGGVPMRGYEAAVGAAMGRSGKSGEIVLLLSSGNGIKKKGDSNAWGHFGMAVKDEKGDHRVWTVHYNDKMGGSFSGGMGEGQMTLGEYLYGLHYHPGANGQAYPLAETSVGPVLAFILRGADEAALETMREMAAFVNATHLAGKDSYSFTNKGMLTNCISLVTKILRAAGFRIAESGTQAPADKAVELIRGFARRLLENQMAVGEFDLLVFERHPHAASSYRIPNVPLGSVYLNFRKPWKEMGWWERLKTVLRRPFEFFSVPSHIAAFAAMATRRVVAAGPSSRELRIEEVEDSPIRLLMRGTEAVRSLRAERVPLMERRRALEDRVLARIGLAGWQRNPGQTLEDLAAGRDRKLPDGEEAALQADLAAHQELDVAITLNRFDELLELRRQQFLKLRIADPVGVYARRMARLRALHARVLERRDRIARERRIPSGAEIEALHALNERVEAELEALRIALLNRLGPAPAQDIRTTFRGQVTGDLLTTLRENS